MSEKERLSKKCPSCKQRHSGNRKSCDACCLKMREWKAERVAKNECTSCKAPTSCGRRCEECAKKERERAVVRGFARVARGQCRRCKTPAEPGKTLCRKHLNEMRESCLLRKYGMSQSDYDKMSEQQNGACAICDLPPKGVYPLAVDHCHTTGKVRSLLCVECNTRLGILEDKSWMKLARAYLKRHNEKMRKMQTTNSKQLPLVFEVSS